MKRAQFFLDGGAPVEGWTTGETWNGFAVPSFDAAQIGAALAELRAAGLTAHLVDDVVVLEDPDMGVTRYEENGAGLWELDGLCWNAGHPRTEEEDV